jgi:hypothetical protein
VERLRKDGLSLVVSDQSKHQRETLSQKKKNNNKEEITREYKESGI